MLDSFFLVSYNLLAK